MKRQFCFLFLIYFVSSLSFLHGRFNFSSQHSKIRIGANGRFFVNRELTNVSGTLDIDPLAQVSGSNSIIFQQGFLKNNRIGSAFSGIYDVMNGGKIILEGSVGSPHFLNAQVGTVLDQVEIRGEYNLISGSPSFSAPIIFDGDTQTTLTIGIETRLNKDLQLNGGTLVLGGDLALADEAMMTGGGTIEFNHKSFHLPAYGDEWNDAFLFKNAKDIELHGKTILNGDWTFTGNASINGNGAILDLSNGGRLIVAGGTQLQLNDIIIKGIGNDAGMGSMLCQAASSKIVFSHVTVELASDFTTSIGNIYVEGTSEVLVKEHEWLFDDLGFLTVDGVTLWTDPAGAVHDGLGIIFGIPEASHYSLVSNGTIIKKSGAGDLSMLESLVSSNSASIYSIQNNITDIQGYIDDATAKKVHLAPGESLVFSTNQTLDGSGKTIAFACGQLPQFVIADGVTVTLENIELVRINNNTFRMGVGSKLKIGENVLFELSQDIVWNYGAIEVVGDSTIWSICGANGVKKLTFKKRSGSLHPILVLGTNTLLLGNIELSGIHLFDAFLKVRDRSFQDGTIVLGGNSTVNLTKSTKMNFIATWKNNWLCLLANTICLDGTLRYGSFADNELFLKFLPGFETPTVSFGTQFATITSTGISAKLIFADSRVRVINKAATSFVMSSRGYLGGRWIEVVDYPIKQVARDVEFAAGLELTSDGDNAIEQDFDNELYKGFAMEDDLAITFHSVKLSRAKNKIRLTGARISDFGVDPVEPLSLILSDGSTLEQGSNDVELKENDVLMVEGKGNKILVKKRFVIKSEVLFEPSSELIIEFGENGVAPEVYFAASSNNLLDLAAGTRLIFRGRGSVLLSDGYRINFGGTVSGQRAEVVLHNFAELALERGASCTFAGDGKLLICNKGIFHIDADSHVVIGADEADSLDILIDRGGELSLDATGEPGKEAKLSLQRAAYSVVVKNSGKLSIGNGGLLEINALNEQEQRGELSAFTFESGGMLTVAQGGQLLLGRNLSGGGFLWDNSEGVIQTGGVVTALATGLTGQLQHFLTGPQERTIASLVDLAINHMPSLLSSLLFSDAQGNQKVRTKNGVIVMLRAGDTVIGDNAKTGTISVLNNNELYSISADGQRR